VEKYRYFLEQPMQRKQILAW